MLLSSLGSVHVAPEVSFSGKYNFISYLNKQHLLYFIVACTPFPLGTSAANPFLLLCTQDLYFLCIFNVCYAEAIAFQYLVSYSS